LSRSGDSPKLYQVKIQKGRNNIGNVACVDRDGKYIIMVKHAVGISERHLAEKTYENLRKTTATIIFGEECFFFESCASLWNEHRPVLLMTDVSPLPVEMLAEAHGSQMKKKKLEPTELVRQYGDCLEAEDYEGGQYQQRIAAVEEEIRVLTADVAASATSIYVGMLPPPGPSFRNVVSEGRYCIIPLYGEPGISNTTDILSALAEGRVSGHDFETEGITKFTFKNNTNLYIVFPLGTVIAGAGGRVQDRIICEPAVAKPHSILSFEKAACGNVRGSVDGPMEDHGLLLPVLMASGNPLIQLPEDSAVTVAQLSREEIRQVQELEQYSDYEVEMTRRMAEEARDWGRHAQHALEAFTGRCHHLGIVPVSDGGYYPHSYYSHSERDCDSEHDSRHQKHKQCQARVPRSQD
jgi:hypothetical protein